MSILGLDVGDRRIGLAVAQENGRLAVPAGAIVRTKTQQDLARLLEITQQRGVTLIVAGLPISINGTLGSQARKTQAFLGRVKTATSLPVEMVDERYSTSEAERLLRHNGKQPSRHRAELDAAAATVILQAYLDQQARETGVQPSRREA